MRQLPSGRVAFVFTDVESSTRLFIRHRDHFPDALAVQAAIITESFGERGGVILSREGDGMFAAFDDVGSAVAAAVDAQRRLSTAAWPDGLVLRVRIGIHAGDAEPVGDDYVSIVVHEATPRRSPRARPSTPARSLL